MDLLIKNFTVGESTLTLCLMQILKKQGISFMEGEYRGTDSQFLKKAIKWVVMKPANIDEVNFRDKYRVTWDRSVQKFAILLSINNTHANVIIIDKQNSTFEYFEPNYRYVDLDQDVIEYFYTLCSSYSPLTKINQIHVDVSILRDRYNDYINNGWCDLICFFRLMDMDAENALEILAMFLDYDLDNYSQTGCILTWKSAHLALKEVFGN